ncbi:retropepsin-like aspartic protease family protein [Calothrix rhizosoleniae]|uniref:retropepsin-like aspartic protease family protein n=1 Tax=Calothrix rhizosoleniae TaxID=888997 RepID=UPI000B49EE20|nr:retropepsin-like aspartic protease [Calothrix rhizosoleniae]
MHPSLLSRTAIILLSTTLSVVGCACSIKEKQMIATSSDRQPIPISNDGSGKQSSVQSQQTAAPVKTKPSPEKNISFQPSAFELALDKATGALNITQSAQSIDDWKLVASQYQDAIALMRKVTKDSPYFDSAQTKIKQYQHQIKYAHRKIKPPTRSSPPVAKNVPERAAVVIPPQTSQPKPQKLSSPQTQASSIPIPVPSPNEKFPAPEILQKPQKVFTAPITRRIGGTPIIQVTFNGDRQFEMILDTGASGTVITQKMAKALAVIPVGKAKANTASAKGVEFAIGYVNSIEIGGAKVNRVAVAIAGSELETGLLGHDFFGNYDITIKRNIVEFRPHTESIINSGENGLAVPVFPKPSHYVESP